MTTFNRNRMNPSAYVSAREFGVAPGNSDNAAALEAAALYAHNNYRRLILPQGTLNFSRSAVVSPTDWRGLYIEGEFSGSPVPALGNLGTRLVFPGTDGLRINLDSNKHEQLHLSGFCVSNGLGTDPSYSKGASPSGILIYINDARPFNYPIGWYLDELSFEGLTNSIAIVRRRTSGSLGPLDPNGFFGEFEARRIHTYRCDNSLYLEGVNPNRLHMEMCRFHVGGTVYIAESGCNLSMSNCGWEDADTSWFRVSPNFFDSFVSLHNCRGEVNGDFVGTVSGVPMHRRSFIRFDAGTPVRAINFTLTGDTQLPGYGEYPVELPSGVSIANYGNFPVTVDANGGTIVTPDSVKVYVPQAGANFIRHFYMPKHVGLGGKRNALPQAPCGIRASGAAGVNISSPPRYEEYLTVTASETAFYSGDNIPRTPDITGPEQMFVVTTAGGFYGGDVFGPTRFKPGSSSITVGGALTVWSPSELIDRTGEYVCVVMIRCDTGTTLDQVALNSPAGSVYNSLLAAGYGCWHKADRDPYASDLRHPDTFHWPIQTTVANGATVEIPFRSGATTPFAFGAEVTVGTARGEYFFTGVAGNAATKYQGAVGTPLTTGSGMTLTAGDGTNANDMGSITVANASGASAVARIVLKF